MCEVSHKILILLEGAFYRMEDNLTRIQNIVGKQLGIEPAKVTPEADFSKELGADSLDQVELVMAIEEEFEMEIEDQAAGQIATVQDALDYIEGRWKK
jgi:acyl carrier protein